MADDRRKAVDQALILAALSLLVGARCSSSADDPPADGPVAIAPSATVPLCDGSTRLTLRVFYASQSDREPFGSAVRVENGFPSFAVDGQCRYSMSGGWLEDEQARDLGWRQGIVSDELRSLLEAKAGAEDLTAAYGCSGVGAADAPPAIIANGRSMVVCRSDAEQAVVELMAVIRQHARELWDMGQQLDGDLRVTVQQSVELEPPRRYTWPAGLALRDYFEADASSFVQEPLGRSKKVAAADAAPLRAIREDYLRDTRPGVLYVGHGIPITDGEISATMYMRDALPYEDERGILPLPEASR